MAVTLGPLTTALVATGTLSTTFAFTSTDQPLYVLLGLYPTQIPRAPTGTVTYGGVALELVNETFYADPGGDRSAIYRLVAPTPGTANLVVTHNEVGCEGVLGVFNTLGQDPGVPHGAAPIWASTLVQKTNTTGSCPVDPAPGDLVVWVTAAATTTDAGAPITMTPVATGAAAAQLYQGLGNSENVCFATAPWPATAVATTWNNNPGGAALAALVLKAAPAVAPVWTATSSSAAGTTNTFVVPSTALVGQLAVAALYFEETGTTALTLTPVAGWTISAGIEQVGSTPDGWLFYAWKRLAAGDLGATVGFASNGSWKEGAMVGLTNALAAGDPLDVAAASAVTGAAGTSLAVPDLTPASQPTLELVLASTAVDTTDLVAPAGLTEAVESGGTAIFTLRRTVTTPPGARTVTWAGAADALGYHLLIEEEPPPLPDGQLLAPSADTSVGTWTTDAGATTNLYQRIDDPTPVAALADDFDDNSLDTGKWAAAADAGTATAETNGRLELTLRANGSGYTGVSGVAQYDLTGASLMVECVDRGTGGTGQTASLEVEFDASNSLKVICDGPSIMAQTVIATANTSFGTVTYSAVAHRWWRIREARGTVSFETGPSAGGPWAVLYSRANPFAVTALRPKVFGGTYASLATPGVPKFDNLSLLRDVDADYVQSVANPQAAAYEAGLPAAADPDVHTGHGVRVRAKMDVASADPVLLTTELRQGAAALSPPAVWTDTLDPIGATFTHALTAAQAAGITDYGVLRERFTASQAPAPAPPTFVAFGTMQSATTAAVTVPWPTSPAIAVGDLALLCVERAGGSASPTLTTANGFAAVTGGEQTTGTGTAGTKITVFWCRATASSMASPVVAASTDHQVAVIVTFRGCVATGNPWDVVGGGVKATASTSVSMTGVTTTVANTLVAYICARDNDANGQIFSAQANASLTGVAERFDDGTLSGGGGGLSVTTGSKAVAGASGTMTATVVSGINAWVTIALKPTAPPAAAARAQVTWTQLSLPAAPARLRTAPAVAALGYTSPYADAILATAGLTAYYQLDDTTGIAYDRVGGRHGAYEGAYSRVAGVPPGGGQSPAAVRFAGAGGVRCPVTQTGTADWTLECWFTPGTLTPATGQILIAVGSDPGGYSMAVSDQLAYGGPGTRFVAISNGYGWADSGYNLLSVTSAYHLVVKRTGGLLVRFYVNGVLQTPSGSGMGQTVPGDCTTIGMGDFGSRDGAVWRRCEGTIDEAAVYNVALSDATVLAHYNAGVGLYYTTYPEARSFAVAGALAVPTETITSAGPKVFTETGLAVPATATVTRAAFVAMSALAQAVAVVATPAVPTEQRTLPEPARAVAAAATVSAPTEILTKGPLVETNRPVAAVATAAKTDGARGAELARAVALAATPVVAAVLVLGEPARPVALATILAAPTERRTLPEAGRTVPLLAAVTAADARLRTEPVRSLAVAAGVTAADAVTQGRLVYDEPLRPVAALAAVAVAAPPLLHESRPIAVLGAAAGVERQTAAEGARAVALSVALAVPVDRRVLAGPPRAVDIAAALVVPVDRRVLAEGTPALTATGTIAVPAQARVAPEPNRALAIAATLGVPLQGRRLAPEEQAVDGEAVVVPAERQVLREPADLTPVLAGVIALPIETARHWEPVSEVAVANVILAAEVVLRGPPQQSPPVADISPPNSPPRVNPLLDAAVDGRDGGDGAGVQPLSDPDTDIGVGGWTTQIGDVVALYAVLDEPTADDGDYVRSGLRPVADALELAFAPFDDAGVSSAGTHLLRFRYGKPAGVVARIDLTVVVRAGTTDVATRTFTDVAAGFADGVVDLTPSEIAAFRAAGGYADPRAKLIADQVG